MIRRPPRSTRTDTLSPYTTLFRSADVVRGQASARVAVHTSVPVTFADELAPSAQAALARQVPGQGGLKLYQFGLNRADIRDVGCPDHQASAPIELRWLDIRRGLTALADRQPAVPNSGRYLPDRRPTGLPYHRPWRGTS